LLARFVAERGLDFVFLDAGRRISRLVEVLLFSAVAHHAGMLDVFRLGMVGIGLVGHERSPDANTHDITALSASGSMVPSPISRLPVFRAMLPSTRDAVQALAIPAARQRLHRAASQLN